MAICKPLSISLGSIFLFPNDGAYEIATSKYFITQYFKVVSFIIINTYPNRSTIRE